MDEAPHRYAVLDEVNGRWLIYDEEADMDYEIDILTIDDNPFPPIEPTSTTREVTNGQEGW